MTNQHDFYSLLDKYNNGIEPLSNWTTADLVALIDAADSELQNRAPPDSSYEDRQTTLQETSDDDY
jgi:hypothetical protein